MISTPTKISKKSIALSPSILKTGSKQSKSKKVRKDAKGNDIIKGGSHQIQFQSKFPLGRPKAGTILQVDCDFNDSSHSSDSGSEIQFKKEVSTQQVILKIESRNPKQQISTQSFLEVPKTKSRNIYNDQVLVQKKQKDQVTKQQCCIIY